MADNRRWQSEVTIARHVTMSVGAGLIPIPAADVALVTAVQLNLIHRLCVLYDVPFQQEVARAALTALIGASLPGLSTLAASGVKAVPGVGTLAGMVAAPSLAAASTYAVGKVFRRHLESGGTLLTFDPKKMRASFEADLEAEQVER